MSPARKRGSDATQPADPNAAVLAELRTMNRLLAAFTTREMPRNEAITFLDASGFGAAQIGEVLRVNPVTVRTTLFRARRAAQAEEAKTSNGAPSGDPGEAPDAKAPRTRDKSVSEPEVEPGATDGNA